jgi:hypothetical protein
MVTLQEEMLILFRRLQRKGFFKIDIGSKVNTNAIAEDNFKLQKGLTGLVLQKIPNNPLTQFNYSSLQMKDYTPIASSFGISGGKSFDVGSEGLKALLLLHSITISQLKVMELQKQVLMVTELQIKLRQLYELKYETNTTGMANIGYKINNNNKVSFNSLYINTSTQSKEEYSGYIVDIANEGNGGRFNYEKTVYGLIKY